MITEFAKTADAVLKGVVESNPRVPGVVAMATDRHMNIYEGAFGKRRLDRAGRHDHGHNIRHLLDDQGDHRHGGAATG